MGLYDRDYYQDSDLQPFRPWNSRSVVTNLIIVNVVVFVANFIFGSGTQDTVNQYLWLDSDHLTQPLHWYRTLTNGFAHSNIGHILFNMLALFFLGQAVENRYGRGEFLRIFLVSIVTCSVVWLIRQAAIEEADAPTRVLLGASGGATAITMLFVFNYPQTKLYIWGILPVKAWFVGLLVVITNLLGNSSFQADGTQQVAYDVHLAGVAFAAVYYYGKFNFAILGSMAESVMGLFQRQPKLRIHQPSDSAIPDRLKVEADRILDKIHREGQDRLTSRERKLLEEYSRAVREQRQK